MGRFRFSIASLLGVVLVIAVALAALRASTDAWDSGVLGLILLILLTATLLVVHRTNPRRAYWLGFALFGWAYLVASFVPPVGSRLPTTQGLGYLASRLPGRESASAVLYRLLVPEDPVLSRVFSGSPQPVVADLAKAGMPDCDDILMFTRAALPGASGTTENFVRIGHSLLALVVALIGGRLSWRLYDKNHVQMAGGDDHPPDNRRRP
jgi:hypothetical protein